MSRKVKIPSCLCGEDGIAASCLSFGKVRCRGCGWNKTVHENRMKRLRENGLTQVGNTRRLIIDDWGEYETTIQS